MIQEIHDKSFFNSFKTVGSLVLMFFFLFVIGITFFLAQTSQDIRQEASNRKTTKIESYLSRLRKSKPSTGSPKTYFLMIILYQAQSSPTDIKTHYHGHLPNRA